MKIFLIGDSIRQGYDKAVKLALDGKAEVYFPDENCRFSTYVLRNLGDWKDMAGLKHDTVDLVHFNVGLWDSLELYGDEPLVDIEFYKKTLDRICKRIELLFPGAKIIFATSTRVIEERYPKNFMRRNSVIEEYNKAAVEVMNKYGYYVNDLYELTKSLGLDHYSDMTHLYTEKGRVAMLRQVLDSICKVMDIKNDFDCEAIVKEVGGLNAPLGL